MFQYTVTILKWISFTKRKTDENESKELFEKIFKDKAEFMYRTWKGLDMDWNNFFKELNQENRETLLVYVLDH